MAMNRTQKIVCNGERKGQFSEQRREIAKKQQRNKNHMLIVRLCVACVCVCECVEWPIFFSSSTRKLGHYMQQKNNPLSDHQKKKNT